MRRSKPKGMRPGRPAIIGGVSETTGYRVTPILDTHAEAALGVLQMLWGGISIAATIRRALVDRAATDAPARLESAVAEVKARREAVAAKRSA